MAAKRTVQKITLKNFKAFRQEQVIDLKNKNVLIYGNNGAGKSSIFWALYTFLQSSIKSDEDINKYFRVFNEADATTHQSLRNVFEAAGENSYIELTVNDKGTIKTYQIPATPIAAPITPVENVVADTESETPSVVEVPIDLSPIAPATTEVPVVAEPDTTIKLLNTTSDFINYKLLSGFYSSSHKYDINLWSVFERDIFPFITDDINDKTFLDKIIQNTTDVWRYESGYAYREGWRKDNYIAWLDADVNGEIDNLLGLIQQYANEFIREHFYNNTDVLKVELEFTKRFTFDLILKQIWLEQNKHIRENELAIKLVVKQYDAATTSWITLRRVQSFLNEAQLTRIALGIRIGALRTRMQTTEFKLLVLDDMLISLDLSNRMEVVKIILNHNNKPSLKFFDSFQKVILTHDKGFYNILKNYTNANEWQYYKLTKVENSNNAPNLTLDKSHIEKAAKFLADGEYDAVGNELRKEVEMILKKYLNHNLNSTNEDFTELSKMIKSAYEKYTENERNLFKKVFVDNALELDIIKKIEQDFENDDSLNPEQKGRLRNLQKSLKKYLIKQYEVRDEKEKLFIELRTILDRIMNPASHASGESMYAQELEDAIEKVKQLKAVLEA